MGAMIEVLEDDGGRLEIRRESGTMLSLQAIPHSTGIHVPRRSMLVDYPLELIRLIFSGYGALYTCDEIGRDVEETEASVDVYHSVAAYCPDEFFARPLRILDYGCGGGSSTMTLARLFPNSEIVGIDYVPKFLEVARGRASYRKLARVRFEQVDPSGRQPLTPAQFDAVFLNAVYEHLMPAERPVLLANLWSSLAAGGTLFLNQTPYRWFPIETHTSGLPLINYLPDFLAAWTVRRFSRRVVKTYDWEQLLRAGIRGATVGEIMRNIRRVDPQAVQLEPIRIARSWPGIWYASKRHRIGEVPRLARLIEAAALLVDRTGLPLSPYITFAARKPE